MIKLASTILILLGVSAVSALGQFPRPKPLSNADTTAIVISVLQPPPIPLSPNHGFLIPKKVSSENLEFVDSFELEKHGIRLMSASALREAQKDWVIDYLLFPEISFRDGVALVTLAQIKEGRPCFAPPMHSESSYTYEVRRTSKGLIATLIRSPAPPMSFDLKRFAMRYPWVKPNKSLDASRGSVFLMKRL
jgi:hypothetical protein